jgi:hypothetical protein
VDPVERPDPEGIFYLPLARTEVSNSCPQELGDLTKELANRLLVSFSAGLSKTLYETVLKKQSYLYMSPLFAYMHRLL